MIALLIKRACATIKACSSTETQDPLQHLTLTDRHEFIEQYRDQLIKVCIKKKNFNFKKLFSLLKVNLFLKQKCKIIHKFNAKIVFLFLCSC